MAFVAGVDAITREIFAVCGGGALLFFFFFVVPMNVGRWAKPDQSMYCFFMSFVFVYFYFISWVMTKVSMVGAREIIRT